MYLKRIELCGFKSFADRTKLDFEPGISAIVGPNGCGKSNVSDGIRWCLGEQSAKSMRSHQMLDVIFAGSHSRQTTGMAEVTLTFDNSKNILPIDYSEVSVTRRLFRSGESEFFLNKAQCRLKDIRDLFLDTGIGTEGYAIIEQGKVEFILSAKPEQKREMFEEAAGVSKYKVRREEALRKLDKVDIDLNRIADMLTLLKEQITSLDIAARKARQYQKYQENLKSMEIASIVTGALRAQEDIDRIKNELDPKSQEYELQNTTLDQLDAELSSLRVIQLEKDELYIKQQDELSQLKSDISLSDERVNQASLRERELKERQDILASDIETGEARVKALKEEMANAGALREKLSAEVSVLESQYLEKEKSIDAVRANIAEAARQISAMKTRLFDIAAEKINRHNDHNRLLSKQAHCQAQAQSLQKELARLSEQFTPLNEKLNYKNSEIAAVDKSVEELGAACAKADVDISELEQRRLGFDLKSVTLKENIASLHSKHETLVEWEHKDPSRHAIQEVMSLNLPGIKGPLSGLIRIDPGMEETVAAALGDKLNYIVSETVESAQKAITHLKETNAGRAVFVILERLEEFPKFTPLAKPQDARELVSLIQYDRAIEKAVRFLCGETLVTDGTFYSFCLIQGGGKVTLDKPVLIEEHLRALSDEVSTARKELEETLLSMNGTAAELAAKHEEKKDYNDRLQQKIAESSWMKKDVSALAEEIQFLEKEISLNKTDIENRSNEENSVKAEIDAIHNTLTALDSEEASIGSELITKEADLSGHQKTEMEHSPLLTEAKVAWATQANELAGRQREEQKLAADIAALESQNEQACGEQTSIEVKIHEQLEIQKTESDKLKHCQGMLTQKENDVQVAINERQAMLQELDSKNTELHNLRQVVETLKMDLHNLQIEQRSFELQKQGMEQRLMEGYSMALNDVKQEYAGVAFSEDEISRLKRKIEQLGMVNLTAPEEYTSLEERYNFLLTQQTDLLKAKDDLHQVISKINQNTRENFKKSFDQIRENFINIYQQLFEGGVADLVLTDENNLLETGVEIYAQPPGKKLQNIALLSGGEKALTAIALLFAFFMVKSSPFCILDEVDAPLDDANVGRFIGMIKDFSSRTQFLVITHNKRTMEMADILYGVTMEELGVSKIISVKLKKENLIATA